MARQTTFFAQGTHVLPIPGSPDRFIFLADRWIPTSLGNSRFQFPFLLPSDFLCNPFLNTGTCIYSSVCAGH